MDTADTHQDVLRAKDQASKLLQGLNEYRTSEVQNRWGQSSKKISDHVNFEVLMIKFGLRLEKKKNKSLQKKTRTLSIVCWTREKGEHTFKTSSNISKIYVKSMEIATKALRISVV